MTWQGVLFGFVLGFLSWPMGTVVMTLVDVWRSRAARRSYEKTIEARKKANEMTVSEWESYYGPLPKREVL